MHRFIGRALALTLGLTLGGTLACDNKADTKADPKADAKKAGDKADPKTAAKADTKTETKTETKTADAKTEAKAPDAKADAGAPPTAAVLTLGKAKFFEVDDPDKPIELAEDGRVSMQGEVGAKITADGKVMSPDGAKVMMEVDAAGKVTAGGKDLGVVVSDTGATITIDGKTSTLTFEADGTMKAEPKSERGDEMRHEGCTGPLVKTCALVMVGVLMVGEESVAPVPPAPVPVDAKAATPPAPK